MTASPEGQTVWNSEPNQTVCFLASPVVSCNIPARFLKDVCCAQQRSYCTHIHSHHNSITLIFPSDLNKQGICGETGMGKTTEKHYYCDTSVLKYFLKITFSNCVLLLETARSFNKNTTAYKVDVDSSLLGTPLQSECSLKQQPCK